MDGEREPAASNSPEQGKREVKFAARMSKEKSLPRAESSFGTAALIMHCVFSVRPYLNCDLDVSSSQLQKIFYKMIFSAL